MLQDETNIPQEEKTRISPDRLISKLSQEENKSTVDILSIERCAQVNEHIVQIDTSLFKEEMHDRYHRASDLQLDLPSPIARTKTPSTISNIFLDPNRHIRLSSSPGTDLDLLIQNDDQPLNLLVKVSEIRRKLFSDEDDILDETPPRRSFYFDIGQRSSSPTQQQNRESYLFRHTKSVTPDCSPIILRINSRQQFRAVTPQPDAVIMTSVTRPTRYISILSSPIANMSIGSPLVQSSQMPSDYARQVLDHALSDLMECSM